MKIKIGFSRSSSAFKIGSLIIRKYLGTDYSHVYLNFFSERLERDIIYEAVGSGVRFVGKKLWDTHAITVNDFEIEITAESHKKLMQFCIDNSGVNYGTMQNIGLVIAKIFKLSKNPFRKGKNCSELIAEILQMEGFNVEISKDLISPKDIETILLNGRVTTI